MPCLRRIKLTGRQDGEVLNVCLASIEHGWSNLHVAACRITECAHPQHNAPLFAQNILKIYLIFAQQTSCHLLLIRCSTRVGKTTALPSPRKENTTKLVTPGSSAVYDRQNGRSTHSADSLDVPRYGRERALNEAASVMFIAEHAKIPVPKLLLLRR
jgi:hypothetical protein